MLNPYLMNELRRAERIFRKAGQPNLAAATRAARGALCDSRWPDETDAWHLIRIANNETRSVPC